MSWQEIASLIVLFVACCLVYELVDRAVRR
jgi:hypothetical protein